MTAPPTPTNTHKPASRWPIVLAWVAVVFAVLLLLVAAGFAAEALTATDDWGSLGLLVTVAIAIPVTPGLLCAITVLRGSLNPPHTAHLAVLATALVASPVLLATYLGLLK